MSYRQLFTQAEAREKGARTKQSKRLDYIKRKTKISQA